METAEAVQNIEAPDHTPLKQGVNESFMNSLLGPPAGISNMWDESTLLRQAKFQFHRARHSYRIHWSVGTFYFRRCVTELDRGALPPQRKPRCATAYEPGAAGPVTRVSIRSHDVGARHCRAGERGHNHRAGPARLRQHSDWQR